MVAKEDGTIFEVTDENLANNRPLWQSVVSRAMLECPHMSKLRPV